MLFASNIKWCEMKKPRISIIGLGRVGSAFLKVLDAHSFEVISVFNRSDITESLIDVYPNTSFYTGLPEDENALGELIILTVSDDAIIEVSEEIASTMSSLTGKFFVHCSGTLSSDVLKELKEKGAEVASFHPMKSITAKTTDFEDAWFDLEGDEAVLSMLENVTDQIGSHSFRIDPEDKAMLHVSAVVASNYLVVLADLASSISTQGNISKETVVRALSSLMQNTLDNISEFGIDEALTGPVARGDIKTVREHIERLESKPGLDLYKKLGLQALEIVERQHKLSAEHHQIRKLLSQ